MRLSYLWDMETRFSAGREIHWYREPHKGLLSHVQAKTSPGHKQQGYSI